MHYLAKETKQREASMRQNLHGVWIKLQKHIDENQVQLCLIFHVLHLFWFPLQLLLPIVDFILNFAFKVQGLRMILFLFLFLWHFRLACQVLLFQDCLTFWSSIALWYNWQNVLLQNHVCHLQKLWQYQELWWKYCHQLWIGLQWIKVVGIGSLEKLCISLFWLVKNSMKCCHIRLSLRIWLILSKMFWWRVEVTHNVH